MKNRVKTKFTKAITLRVAINTRKNKLKRKSKMIKQYTKTTITNAVFVCKENGFKYYPLGNYTYRLAHRELDFEADDFIGQSYLVWNEDNVKNKWIVDKETFESTYKEIK